MHTVLVSESRFNDSAGFFQDDGFHRAQKPLETGHADEITVDPADDDARAADYWADVEQGLLDFYQDQAVREADNAVAAELKRARVYAKGLIGPTAKVKLSREVQVGDDGRHVVYVASIFGAACNYFGGWDTPEVAVDKAVESLHSHMLTPAFGGWRVKGLALVTSGHFRGKADALDYARRIALDPAYLDVALRLGVPGITDERPGRAPVALPAA